MKKYRILIAAIIVILVGAGIAYAVIQSNPDDSQDTETVADEVSEMPLSAPDVQDTEETQAPVVPQIDYTSYPLRANLPPVAETLQGYSYANSSGVAYFDPSRDGDNLYVEFAQLPEISSDFFYEGWLVDTSGSSVFFISTGEATLNGDGIFVDTYEGTDLTRFNRYVLTLEPRDDNPDPAEHVVEANFAQV